MNGDLVTHLGAFRLKKFISDYGFLIVLTGGIIFLDQLSKAWVRANLGYGEMWSPWPWLTPYARVVHISNTGAAFGMFQNMSMVFTILAIIVSAVILFYYPQISKEDWPLRLALGMQLGGAVGNLIDRVTIGSVTDFISVGRFAVFNVADASISLGVAVLLIGMWMKERDIARKAATRSDVDVSTQMPNQESHPTSLPPEE
jgi:signal peptidase II